MTADPRRDAVVEVVRRLREKGHTALLAGGCVRDSLLGRRPKDYDVATSALPDQVIGLFEKTIPVGAQFGVVRVVTGAGDVEVATFRADGEYLDGRRPVSVTYCDPEQDARRRDFTVNAMFMDPLDDRVLDYVGGRADLEHRIIRAVGDPEKRFEEDRLRLLRAVRFAAALDFSIEPGTESALRRMASQVTGVSWERIRDEVLTLLTGNHPRHGLELMDTAGLLSAILPEVAATHGVGQPPEFHPEGDVWIHTLLVMEHLQPAEGADARSPELSLAAVLHDIGKPQTFSVRDRIRFDGHPELGATMSGEICARLRMSTDSTRQVVSLVREHLRFKDVKAMRISTLKRFLRMDRFPEHLALHRADCLGSHGDLSIWSFCREKLEEFATADRREALRPEPLLRGDDLIVLGYRPGPVFSRILELVEDAQLEGRVTTREEAAALVTKEFPLSPA